MRPHAGRGGPPLRAPQAVQKLTYLHMLGNDIGWAAFNIVEVLSQERFGFKRIGCLAASQSFTPTTDVILLCTQQFKRDFQVRPRRWRWGSVR